jgi:hypothetical protein
VEFQTAIPVHEPPPEELEDELLELDDELLLEELLDDELELDELLDELEDEELELDELLDEELDELLLEPVVSHTPRSVQALVQAQPTPGSYGPPVEHQPPTVH